MVRKGTKPLYFWIRVVSLKTGNFYELEVDSQEKREIENNSRFQMLSAEQIKELNQ